MSTDSIVLYGADWCPDCRTSKAFLGDHRIEYTYVNLEDQPDAVDAVFAYNDGKQIIPTIVFPDGSHLAEPTNEELAEKLGLTRSAATDTYDVVIVGGGPTGLTTAIYTAREDLRTLVVERSGLGGQAGITERLDNYPGFPEGVEGAELAERFVAQAQRYGVELLTAVAVTELSTESGKTIVTMSTGQTVVAGAVVVATGSRYRRTGAQGEADLIGAGVHFCATCDGPFYKDADSIVVVGGGNSGLEEGLFLTKFAKQVTVIERGESSKGSKILLNKVNDHPRMSLQLGTELLSFKANEDGRLTGVRVRSESGETEISATGAFIFIGLDPNTEWLDGLLDLDAGGFIVTDRLMATSVPNIFAAGDVRAGSTKQLASAVGEGAAVALQIRAVL
ncbi:MAG: FAD-dependent oxidoreductase [Candidatus Nanopelagicales bacterium]